MSYAAAATVDTLGAVKTMSIFRGVSNKELSAGIREAEADAAKLTSRDLRSIIPAIIKRQPWSLSEATPGEPTAKGRVSRFFARLGM